MTGFTSGSDNKLLGWIQTYITMMDIFTNFLCVVLYYTPFKPLYGRLCSCCDSVCSDCWTNCVTATSSNSANNLKMIQKSIAGHNEVIIHDEVHNESTMNETATTPDEISIATKSEGIVNTNHIEQDSNGIIVTSSTPISEQSDNYTVNGSRIVIIEADDTTKIV